MTGALLAASACGSSTKSSAPSEVTNGVVSMDIVGPVTSYDPAKGSSFQDGVVAWSPYDSLVTFDTNGEVIGALASDWKATSRGATFTLKSGVTCADGSALTPTAVADSVRRFLDPKTASPFLNLVIGAGNTATVEPTKDGIEVSLAQPFGGLLNGLALPFAGVVCPAGLKDPKTLQTKSQGTGAFVATEQVAGASYTFSRRKDYEWGAKVTGAPSGALPKELVMKVVTDDNTRSNLMSTDALQIGTYTSQAWTKFKDAGGVKTVSSPQTDTFLIFNETAGHPTADADVRKAIVQAVNRKALNEVQSHGGGEIIDNLGVKSYECYDESLVGTLPEYDAKAAADVLRGVSIKVIGTNALSGGDGNSYLLSGLEAAGADASLRNMDNDAWVTELFSGNNDWDVTILGYGNTVSSIYAAGGFFSGPAVPAGQNIGAVDNAEATSALAEAGRATGEARCEAVSRFQRALFERSDVMPLSTIPAHVVFAGGVDGAVLKGFVLPATIRIP